MALWGKADSIYSPGTVTVNYTNKTITGSGTSFLAATVGSVIAIGAGGTFGKAVISGITSETQISIATTQYLSGAPITGVAYTMSQQPIYAIEDTNYSDTYNTSVDSAIYGVDENETSSAVNTQYAVAHAGWVGVHTYVDMHGNLRVKSETLVAMSGISTGDYSYTAFGDAQDDVVFKDRFITILTQPSNTSTGSGVTAFFSVSAISTPPGNDSLLTYQWQKSTTVGGSTFSNVGGATTSMVGVSTTLTGYRYRVIVSADAATSVTSNSATLTIV